ncbi:uncharacterized protein ACLA_059640 [Aspergillus clavatus NRRL 1]|uniref:CHAT domain-containing protein n=1 Tax=Aspergillus clavatus (strain ATCC 1007 / CBS 513.65 / DSM 816 / NCTC 3887 / NRRL 1 / QM 1276 / 107) TaxID=344612 RepID=A1C4F7_ASPCL|nr:uncharacterized protein ACLA_059640 [Aspergillus clavatus NRRL 1]EAW15297.1 conserved hypothetical protein [Aspergillus clavatus NRRL 1]
MEKPAQITIPPKIIDAAKAAFARDHPLTDDLRPGTFFDNADYLDTLPLQAKALICAIQDIGEHPDRPAMCHIQSEQALNRYLQARDKADLTAAFAFEAVSLRYVPPQHPGRGKSNHHMGRLYQEKWESGKSPADLDETIRHYKIAVDVATENDGVLSDWVNDVAALVTKRCIRTRQESDREDARKYFDRAIELAQQSPTRALILSNKGELIRLTMSDNDKNREALLNEAIVYHDEATVLCEIYQALPFKPRIPYGMIHRNAALAYIARCTATNSLEDGEKACALQYKALSFGPVGNGNWELFMNELGVIHKSRAQVFDDPEEEEELACIAWQEVIENNPSAINARVHLAEFYRQKADKSLDRKAAEEWFQSAVELAEDAVRILPAHHANPGRAYDCCSAVHYSKYEFDGEVANISRAVACARMATQDVGSNDLWNYYRVLAQTLITRYERLQEPDDLRDSEVAAKAALSKCRPGDLECQSHCQWILGKITRAMYDSSRKTDTLHRALEIFRLANEDMPKDTLSKSLVLNDLGNSLTQLFSHEAVPEYLEKAINAYSESLSCLEHLYKTDQHPDVLMVNASLGYVMMQRFIHWGAETDIESGIKYCRRSLSHIDERHPRYAMRAANLSHALQLQFGIKSNLDGLKEAQRVLTVALEGPVPLSDQLRTGLATNLGNAYQHALTVSKQPSDLENAIENYNKAIAVQGASTAARATALMNKAACLKKMAEIADHPGPEFEGSNKAFEEAQKALGEDDPHYWAVLCNHADLLFTLYNQKTGPDPQAHGLAALNNYSRLTKMKNVPPAVRINIASLAASLANDLLQGPAQARDYILICLNLLPEAILMHESRLEQLRFIRKCQYVPSSVAALSLSAGDPPSAVIHRLEAGRAFIWDRIQGQPTQLDALEIENGELAARFRVLQQRILQQSPSSGGLVGMDLTSVSPDDANRMQRQHDADAYREVLQEIRTLPGFGSFLRTPDVPVDLQRYAADAPIVFINASNYRSDALIITKDNVYSLPLPSFSMDRLALYCARFIRLLGVFSRPEEQADAFADYVVVMRWLWQAAAKPILNSIDWTKYDAAPYGKPRVTWVSTGWISVLPIHAAGDFRHPGESVHDVAVSSYITSLKALDFTRQNALRIKQLPVAPGSRQAMLAAMATTPGLGPSGDLDVEPEITAIEKTLKPSFRVNVLRQTDSRSVKTSLSTATVAHFACHARADPQDPSRSAILLEDNQKKPAPFTVRTLLRLNLKSCEMVYLSACESGASKDLQLRDEGIHVAGGFQIAGVPHVISTLWAVSDSVSVQLAGLFYANLREDGEEVDLSKAPYALHCAIGEMRRQGVHPLLLGPFIHSGP